MDGCLFCMISKGDIPSNKVYEDESVLAFRDINPQAPTHILVIPKEHVADSAAGITAENSAVVGAYLRGDSEDSGAGGAGRWLPCNHELRQGGGQTVPHLHFHILAGADMAEKLI